MKKILSLFLLALLALACTKPIPDLELKSKAPVSFTKAGGNATISFTAYTSWTASSDASWLTVSPSKGDADIEGTLSSIKLTARTNEDYDDRTAIVSIISNDKTYTIAVTQDKKTGLYLTDKEKTVDFSAQELVVSGQANVERKVEIDASCADWISLSQTKGLASFDIKLDIAENESESERKGVIKIISDDPDAADSFTVTQTGKPSILFCETPGIYRKRVMQAGFSKYESQIGFFSRAAGTTEFHIVNAAARKFCIIKDMKPVTGESGPESPYSVKVRQNMSSRLDTEFSLSLTVYKYEDGTIWGLDEEKGLGAIIRLK